jgi:hypothetical protein
MTDKTDKIDNAAEARAIRRAELEQAEFTGGDNGSLMQPANGRELLDMANLLATSGTMIKDFYRNSPGDCAALIMICQPYGFNPYLVSWKTYKASKGQDAPVSFEAQLIMAMVNMSSPTLGKLRYEFSGEGQSRSCTVIGVERETKSELKYVSPPLSAIPVKNSPLWKSDPDQQLVYFSSRAWCRRHFPELLLGIYAKDELEAAPIRDITPSKGGFADRAEQAKLPANDEIPLDIPEEIDAEKVEVMTAAELLARQEAGKK